MPGRAPPNAERNAVRAAVVAVLLWSTVATGFKLGLAVLAPVQLLLLGTTVSAAVFVIAASVTSSWEINRRSLAEAAVFGLVNPCLYYLVLFEAYDRLPAQIAQPLNYTWAITLAVLAVPILKQPLSRPTLAGIVISYAGVVVLLSQGSFERMNDLSWIGVALALASTLVWASYWLMNTRSNSNALSLMALSFLIAIPALISMCLMGPGLPRLSMEALLYGSWVGLIEMGVTFLLWQRALRLTDHAARIGQLIFISPFISLLLISGVLGEQIHLTTVAGLAVIVVGFAVTRQAAR
ncbi:MAG: DMT family transporter [Gammaproteobacteria bacterium]|nr:DMT family transporter [Gammaproteobacteria bacterium]